jgi:membrane protease YdiL (CAAX protease family)
METTTSKEPVFTLSSWTPLLWVLFAFASMWAASSIGLSLLTYFAELDEALAQPLAHLFASVFFYSILSWPVWRDGKVSAAPHGNARLGAIAKKFLIFLAVLIPLGVNLLLFLLPPFTDRLGIDILTQSQKFQNSFLLIYWGSTFLLFLVYVVVAPLVEEHFFRQWYWRRTEPLGLSSTISSTSILFILIYPVDLVGKIALLPLTALVVFARIRTGGPHFGIWLHGINNLCAIIASQMLVVWFR